MDIAAEQRMANGMDVGNDAAPPAAARLLAWCDRNRRRLLVAIIILYAAAFTGRWRINPDSAIYMSLGRSIAETGHYVYNGEHHTRYEPGLPLVIAASYRLFGGDRYAPILLFEFACSLASLALTYRLLRRHAGRPTAVLVATGFGISQTCMRYGFQVVTDTPFLVGVLAYLLAYEHLVAPPTSAADTSTRDKWRWLAWLTIPLATFLMVTFRPTALTFVAAVGLACAWHLCRGTGRKRHIIIGLLTLAAFFSFRYVDPRRSSAGAEVKREQRLKSLLTEQRSYFISRIPRQALSFTEEVVPKAVFATEFHDAVPGVGTAVSLVVIASVVSLLRRHALWGLWCLGTFAQLVWLPRERYLLPILPLLVYGMWLEVLWLARRPKLSPAMRTAAVAVPFSLYVLPNLALDLHLLGEQRRVGVSQSGAVDPNDAVTLKMAHQIASVVGEQDASTMVFATDHDELSYFSRRRVDGTPWSGRWPPTKKELGDALQAGRAASRVYAVLPDSKKEGQSIEDFVNQLGMKPAAEAAATVARPPGRKGKTVEPLTLYLLVPAGGPTTSAAAAEGAAAAGTAGDATRPPK